MLLLCSSQRPWLSIAKLVVTLVLMAVVVVVALLQSFCWPLPRATGTAMTQPAGCIPTELRQFMIHIHHNTSATAVTACRLQATAGMMQPTTAATAIPLWLPLLVAAQPFANPVTAVLQEYCCASRNTRCLTRSLTDCPTTSGASCAAQELRSP